MHKLGNKDQARKLAVKAGVPVVPGSDGLIQSEEQALDLRAGRRLPRAHQGGGRRRRTRHARGPRRGVAEDRTQRRQPRGRKRLQGRQRLPGKLHRPAAPRRSPALRRPSRQCRPPLGARLFLATAAPEARRGVAGPEPARRRAPRHVRGRRAPGQDGRLPERRHLRVPGRSGKPLLFHRGQRPHPGRTSGHGTGHGHRSGEGANPRGGRRTAVVPPGGRTRTAAPPWSAGSTPKTPPPTSGLRRA